MSLEGSEDMEYVKGYTYPSIALQTTCTDWTPNAVRFYVPVCVSMFPCPRKHWKQGLHLSNGCLCRSKRKAALLWADTGPPGVCGMARGVPAGFQQPGPPGLGAPVRDTAYTIMILSGPVESSFLYELNYKFFFFYLLKQIRLFFSF